MSKLSIRAGGSGNITGKSELWNNNLGADVPTPTTDGKLEPEALNDTNLLELRVYTNQTHRQAVLVALLDNLGKGASGAAVQNIGLMLGLDEATTQTVREPVHA